MSSQEQDIFDFSTGVRLRLHTPSPMLLAEAMRPMLKTEPRPPRVFVEAKSRDEENPSDPGYITAWRIWQMEAGVRCLRALIPTGTTLLSKPDDMVGPEDEDFADLMETMGQEPGQGKHSRYVQWVMSVAAGVGDLDILGPRLMRLAGVREEDVAEALERFPGVKERFSDNGPDGDRGGEDRDSVPDPSAGARTGD